MSAILLPGQEYVRNRDGSFWSKVEVYVDGCWLWRASCTQTGHGHVHVPGKGTQLAHRVAFEIAYGPIPSGLTVDHLCRVRNCVRPDHLELVTPVENTMRGVGYAAKNARKTHCIRGHEFTPDNTRIRPVDGGRECRECRRTKQHSN